MPVLVCGLCGGGTVGGGVIEICNTKKQQFEKMGINIRFKTICVRDISKKRDFAIPENCSIVSDYHAILDDPEIACVIEVMGGVTDAKEVVFGAIKRGKHVITANKPLIAQYLPEIENALRENKVMFGYEAAVCGGIPIIHTLQRDYAGDNISRIAGIMNGTTNFILTKMDRDGVDFLPVLKEAQDLGYAEADPAADVEGWDARSKLCILAKLCFGVHVPEDQIYCVGIKEITSDDFSYARSQLQSTIKILGVAQRTDTGVSLYVSPVLVPLENMIASSGGVTNVVQVASENLNTASYVGPGAGRFPTANSVISDLAMVAVGGLPPPFPPPADHPLLIDTDISGRFYLRFTVADELGIIRRTGELCEKFSVSIHAVLQTPIKNPEKVCFVVTTEVTKRSLAQSVCRAMEAEPFSRGPSLLLPLFA